MNVIIKKWIFSTLFALTSFFILAEAGMSGNQSGQQSTAVADFLANIINKIVPSTPLVVEPTDFSIINAGNIPLGSSRNVSMKLIPSNSTYGVPKFYLKENTDGINLIQKGSTCEIEGMGLGNYTLITELDKKVGQNPITKQTFFSVVDREAPNVFDATISSQIINVGETAVLNVEIKGQDINGKEIENQLIGNEYYDPTKLIYYSSDLSVASIDSFGVIRGLSVGQTIVKAKGHDEKSFVVNVINPSVAIIKPSSLTIRGGKAAYIYDCDYDKPDDRHFTALSLDWGTTIPSDQKVTWTSSDLMVARVDEEGKARGYKKIGKAIITAVSNMDSAISSSIEINVGVAAPTNFSFSGNHFNIREGKYIDLSATFYPINTTDKTLLSVSSDDTIASVSSSSSWLRVYAHKPGEAEIIVSSFADASIVKIVKVDVVKETTINTDNFDSFQLFIRKSLGHFSLFMVDGVLGFLAAFYILSNKKNIRLMTYSVFVAVILGLIISVSSELIEALGIARTASINDVLIDVSGYILGVVITWLVYYFIRKRKKRIQKAEIN